DDGALDGAAGGDRPTEDLHHSGDLLLGEPVERELYLLGDREIAVLGAVRAAVRPQAHLEVLPEAARQVDVAAHSGTADQRELQQLAGVDLPLTVTDRDLDPAPIATHQGAVSGAVGPHTAGA